MRRMMQGDVGITSGLVAMMDGNSSFKMKLSPEVLQARGVIVRGRGRGLPPAVNVAAMLVVVLAPMSRGPSC